MALKSTGGASPENTGTKPVSVGANSRVTPPGNFFTGEIDEVRLWNDDLTAQQVSNAFAGTTFNTGEQSIASSIWFFLPPVANNQNLNTTKNTAKSITLTATDPENDALHYTIVTPPTNGTLSGTGPNLSYNPDTDFVGADSFTFKANDGTNDSNMATVNIDVQLSNPPVASNQNVNTIKNTAKSITLTATDPENDALHYTISNSADKRHIVGDCPQSQL